MRKMIRSGASLSAQFRALSSLTLLVSFSLFIAVALTMGSVASAYPLFQSPVSPVATATPTAGLPAVPSPEPPTAVPVEGETPTVSPEGPVPTTEPETPLPTGGPETPAATPEDTPTVEAVETTVAEEAPSRFSNLPWATLVDAGVVGASYLWLCCGAVVLVLFVVGMVLVFLMRRR